MRGKRETGKGGEEQKKGKKKKRGEGKGGGRKEKCEEERKRKEQEKEGEKKRGERGRSEALGMKPRQPTVSGEVRTAPERMRMKRDGWGERRKGKTPEERDKKGGNRGNVPPPVSP